MQNERFEPDGFHLRLRERVFERAVDAEYVEEMDGWMVGWRYLGNNRGSRANLSLAPSLFGEGGKKEWKRRRHANGIVGAGCMRGIPFFFSFFFFRKRDEMRYMGRGLVPFPSSSYHYSYSYFLHVLKKREKKKKRSTGLTTERENNPSLFQNFSFPSGNMCHVFSFQRRSGCSVFDAK